MNTTRRNIVIATACAVTLVALGCGQALLQTRADAPGAMVEAPRFEVDPLWPKPLPNHWLLGMTIGVWVDDHDNIWIIHRGAATLNDNERALELKTGECCIS